MKNGRLSYLRNMLFAALVGSAVLAAPTFGPDGLTLAGLRPGTKVAWISMERTRVDHHSRLTTSRGLAVVTPAGIIAIGPRDADKTHSLFALASVEEDVAFVAAPATTFKSNFPIEAEAMVGADRIRVQSPTVELLYVSRRGNAVWWFSGSAGTSPDGTAQTDIDVPLRSLQSLHGRPSPPSTIAEGDVVVMIDTRSNRGSILKVTR